MQWPSTPTAKGPGRSIRGRCEASALSPCLAALLLPLAADSCTAGIGSNFNGTPIAGGTFVWFNAVAKVKGVSSTAATSIHFDSGTIDFTAAGTAYSLNVPASTVVFSPAATAATTTFDGASWTTTVPASYAGNVFLSGLPFAVPAGGLPGGINPVRWSGQLTSGTAGLTVQWKWAAAVYTQFSADPGAEGVKPIRSSSFPSEGLGRPGSRAAAPEGEQGVAGSYASSAHGIS